MRVLILGSAAGSGFPQWNCHCSYCEGVRSGTLRSRVRTCASIAISADDQRWLLINASPDLAQQFQRNPELWPSDSDGSAPLTAVLLTDARLEHVGGLLTLRDGGSLPLHCTSSVAEELSGSVPLLPGQQHWLSRFKLNRLPDSADKTFSLSSMPSLSWRVVPLNSPTLRNARTDTVHIGDAIGLFVQDHNSGHGLFYAPTLGMITPVVRTFMEKAHCVLVDGTYWSNDELETAGNKVRATDLGHLPLTGPRGMLDTLSQLRGTRKILTHINHTNPILDESSPQYQHLEMLEVEVAFDGLTIEL